MINLVLGARLSDGSYKGNNLAGTTANSVDGWNPNQLNPNAFGRDEIEPQRDLSPIDKLSNRDSKCI